MPDSNEQSTEPDRDAVVAAVQAWIEAELPVALSRSGKVQIEIHIGPGSITPSLRVFYNLDSK